MHILNVSKNMETYNINLPVFMILDIIDISSIYVALIVYKIL